MPDWLMKLSKKNSSHSFGTPSELRICSPVLPDSLVARLPSFLSFFLPSFYLSFFPFYLLFTELNPVQQNQIWLSCLLLNRKHRFWGDHFSRLVPKGIRADQDFRVWCLSPSGTLPVYVDSTQILIFHLAENWDSGEFHQRITKVPSLTFLPHLLHCLFIK